jgi:hypothetical protein
MSCTTAPTLATAEYDMVSAHLQLAFLWLHLINTRNGTGMAEVMTDDFVGTARPRTMGFEPSVGKEAYISRFLSAPIPNFNVRLNCLSIGLY